MMKWRRGCAFRTVKRASYESGCVNNQDSHYGSRDVCHQLLMGFPTLPIPFYPGLYFLFFTKIFSFFEMYYAKLTHKINQQH
jgi:hypothetical protein